MRSVRGQIGIVTQGAYVFGSTIRDNISLNEVVVSEEAVEQAARLACIHDDIVAMPMGYDTMLVDAGASLSLQPPRRCAGCTPTPVGRDDLPSARDYWARSRHG